MQIKSAVAATVESDEQSAGATITPELRAHSLYNHCRQLKPKSTEPRLDGALTGRWE